MTAAVALAAAAAVGMTVDAGASVVAVVAAEGTLAGRSYRVVASEAVVVG